MTREILFRGKGLDGEWYYGYFTFLHKTTFCCKGDYEMYEGNDLPKIVYERMTDWGLPNRHLEVDVDINTVGQWTGMMDKKGKMIFEGDIVRKRVYDGVKPCKVVFSNGCFNCGYGSGSSTAYHPYLLDDKNIEVIGNVYDNPELLGDM